MYIPFLITRMSASISVDSQQELKMSTDLSQWVMGFLYVWVQMNHVLYADISKKQRLDKKQVRQESTHIQMLLLVKKHSSIMQGFQS